MTGRAVRVAAAAAAGLACASCSSSFGMPRGGSAQGSDIFNLWRLFFIVALVVAAIVYGLIAWSLIRYRRRRSDGDRAVGRPFRANIPLEIVYTTIPVVIVVVLFVFSFRTEQRVDAITPDPTVTLHATAFSWGWRFAYAGPPAFTIVSPPSGEGVPGPVVELPRGRTTRVVLTSEDVIHAFWVPGFLFKRDAIPGRTSEFDVTATVDGTYHGVCAEFCGLNHAYMTFTVNVVEPQAFAAWVAAQAEGST